MQSHDIEGGQERPRIGSREFEDLVHREMGARKGFQFSVEEIGWGFARIRLRFHEHQLRPGGSIAGPVLFTLADSALFAAVLSVVGPDLRAVTTDMSIHFLRKPPAADVVAECRLLRYTGRLLVGQITLFSDRDPDPVAQATGTYAVPDR